MVSRVFFILFFYLLTVKMRMSSYEYTHIYIHIIEHNALSLKILIFSKIRYIIDLYYVKNDLSPPE